MLISFFVLCAETKDKPRRTTHHAPSFPLSPSDNNFLANKFKKLSAFFWLWQIWNSWEICFLVAAATGCRWWKTLLLFFPFNFSPVCVTLVNGHCTAIVAKRRWQLLQLQWLLRLQWMQWLLRLSDMLISRLHDGRLLPRLSGSARKC